MLKKIAMEPDKNNCAIYLAADVTLPRAGGSAFQSWGGHSENREPSPALKGRLSRRQSNASFVFRSLLGILLMLVAPSQSVALLAAEEAPAHAAAGDESPLADQVEQLDRDISELAQSEETLRSEILETRRRATDLDRNWQSVLGELDQIESRQKELEQKLKEQSEAAEKADKKRQEAMSAAGTARKELEDAQKRLTEAEKRVSEATLEYESASKPLSEFQTELTALTPKTKPLLAKATEAKDASATLHETIESLETRAAAFERQQAEQGKKIESLLRDANQWVSFTDQIAPIFHQRCVACHNARNAQGRYNMANFDAMHSVGESGEAIIPGDATNSRLLQFIEDGSMPFDADPLSNDEITLVRRWIELGARIESSAETGTPLIRLMPRVTQPAPPQRYRVSIPVTAVATDPSGKILASSGYHEVLLWSLPSAELTTRISNIAERVYGLAFHPDGTRLAVASGTPGQLGEVKLFDVQSGKLLRDLLVSEDAIFGVTFSPDGSRLAACGADGTIAIFSLDDASVSPRLIEDHSDWVNSINWSPDGKLLVSTSRDKTAKVFDAETGKLLITFADHNQNVTEAVFFSDGKRVVSAGDDRKLRIWNVADAKETRDIGGVGSEISGLVFVANDQILSAGSDNKIRIHSAADGKPLKTLAISADWILSVAMTADAKTVILGDQAGNIHRIDLGADAGEGRVWLAVPN